jgi:hypothetical protein
MDLGTSSLDHPAPPLEDDVIWTDTERFAMLAARTGTVSCYNHYEQDEDEAPLWWPTNGLCLMKVPR